MPAQIMIEIDSVLETNYHIDSSYKELIEFNTGVVYIQFNFFKLIL